MKPFTTLGEFIGNLQTAIDTPSDMFLHIVDIKYQPSSEGGNFVFLLNDTNGYAVLKEIKVNAFSEI